MVTLIACIPVLNPHAFALPACSELLLFLLPLVNVKAIKHAVRSHLPRLPMLSSAAAGAAGAAAAAHSSAQRAGEPWREPCPICSAAEVLSPWAAEPCGHVFCYFCLRSHCLADPQYSCPLCLRRVEAMRPAVQRCGESSGGRRVAARQASTKAADDAIA